MTLEMGLIISIIIYLLIEGVADIYRQVKVNLRLNSLERSRDMANDLITKRPLF